MLNGHVDVVPIGDPAAWSHARPVLRAGRRRRAVRPRRLRHEGRAGRRDSPRCLPYAGPASRLRGDLLLACVPGEEDGGLGTFAMLRRGWRADACVVPEPTGLDLVTANAGALTFRLRVPGLATHASRRTEGVSAVEKFVPLLAALQRLEAARNAEVDPLMAPLGDGLPAVDRPGAGRRLGVHRARPAGRRGPARRRARRAGGGRPGRARARGGRGERRRPVAARPPGDGRVVGRAVRVRPAARPAATWPTGWPPRTRRHRRRYAGPLGCAVRQRPAAARPARRHPDAALRTRRRACWPTLPTRACRWPMCTPRPAPWPCSPWTSAAPPDPRASAQFHDHEGSVRL